MVEPMLTIAQVTGYYPPSLGGVEQRVQKLSELLADRGYQVEVFTSSCGVKPHMDEPMNNLKVHYLKSFTFANTPIIPVLFFRLMRLPRKSLIHLHVYHAFTPEIVFIVSRIRNVPYVAHVRLEMELEGRFAFLLPFYKKWFLGPVLRGANRVVCLTDDYADLVVNKYHVPKSKVVVIPNATDFSILAASKHTLHKPVRLLFVGRLSKQKNVPMLLEVINRYRVKFGSNIHLDIVGSGKLDAHIRKLVVEYRLTKEVTMQGALYGLELQRAFEKSDIFVLTTLYESFGSVYIEAMAKALPIVSTKINAVRNVVVNERNGLLSVLEIENFCLAIHRLIIDNDLYARISSNNLHDVQSYRWNVVIQKTQETYNDIVSKMV